MTGCPYADVYGPSCQDLGKQNLYDPTIKAAMDARAERTARSWAYIFQKGRSCRLTGTYCAEYDLPSWEKCPVLKRLKAAPRE